MSFKLKTILCTGGMLLGTVGMPSNNTGVSAHEDDAHKQIDYTVFNSSELVESNHYDSVIHFNINENVYACAQNYNVVYTTAGGAQIMRQGGTRAWRNNNPGCIRHGQLALNNGAIGHAGGFAVFPDEQTGMNAICALLRSDSYKNKTIATAMYSYAPPFENNTAAYNRYLARLTGLPTTSKLADLTNEQIMRLARAIRQVEGWREGVEKTIRPDTIMQNKLQKTL